MDMFLMGEVVMAEAFCYKSGRGAEHGTPLQTISALGCGLTNVQ